MNLVDVLDNAGLVLRPAPDGPLDGTVFAGRLRKGRGRLSQGGLGDLPPGLFGVDRQGQSCQQDQMTQCFHGANG